MTDIRIRQEGHAGRITLTRPQALNALSLAMTHAVDRALRDWADDPAVSLVLIDAEGDKAFCAGGDIVEMYETGMAGDYGYGRAFWRDEYRMNARLARYPKPVVTFLQGFTMGGGVGLGCHASHRITCESTRIAMPECAIGLVPDVGGSLILARINAAHPGLGAAIGATGHRLGPADAALGFADHYVPQAEWPALKAQLCKAGAVDIPAREQPPGEVRAALGPVAPHFCNDSAGELLAALREDGFEPAAQALKALSRASPFAVACHLEILRRLTPASTIEDALALEYRYTWRCMEQGDFLEGIRAAVIDKDRNPAWAHRSLGDVAQADVQDMLAPLGDNELTFREDTP